MTHYNGNPNDGSERIVCAAIWLDDGQHHPHQPTETGIVVCGHRHAQCILMAGMLDPAKVVVTREMTAGRHQGFLTSWNRYVGREEALKIAMREGQVREKVGAAHILFSEDLY